MRNLCRMVQNGGVCAYSWCSRALGAANGRPKGAMALAACSKAPSMGASKAIMLHIGANTNANAIAKAIANAKSAAR